MHRLLPAVLLLTAVAVAQDRPVKLCVGLPANASQVMLSDSLQRSRLVQFITAVGGQKKARAKITALALESITLSDAISEARRNDCRFVLVSEFDGALGSLIPSTGPMIPIGPSARSARRSAQISYSLASVEDGVPFHEGVAPISDVSSDDTVTQAIRDVGDRVVKNLRKRQTVAGD